MSPLFPKAKFCFVTERLHRDIAAILLPCSMDPGRINWSAPLDSSWARREQRINSPGQEISLSGWIMENQNTPSLPPVWLGALHITNHYKTQSCIFGSGQQSTQPLTKHPLEQTWPCGSSTAWDSGVIASEPCLWLLQAHLLPAGCQGSHSSSVTQLMLQESRPDKDEDLCNCSRSFPASPTYLKQCDLEPPHQYLINVHIKYINQPFRCCNGKSEVRIGDRQLLLKHVSVT